MRDTAQFLNDKKHTTVVIKTEFKQKDFNILMEQQEVNPKTVDYLAKALFKTSLGGWKRFNSAEKFNKIRLLNDNIRDTKAVLSIVYNNPDTGFDILNELALMQTLKKFKAYLKRNGETEYLDLIKH